MKYQLLQLRSSSFYLLIFLFFLLLQVSSIPPTPIGISSSLWETPIFSWNFNRPALSEEFSDHSLLNILEFSSSLDPLNFSHFSFLRTSRLFPRKSYNKANLSYEWNSTRILQVSSEIIENPLEYYRPPRNDENSHGIVGNSKKFHEIPLKCLYLWNISLKLTFPDPRQATNTMMMNFPYGNAGISYREWIFSRSLVCFPAWMKFSLYAERADYRENTEEKQTRGIIIELSIIVRWQKKFNIPMDSPGLPGSSGIPLSPMAGLDFLSALPFLHSKSQQFADSNMRWPTQFYQSQDSWALEHFNTGLLSIIEKKRKNSPSEVKSNRKKTKIEKKPFF